MNDLNIKRVLKPVEVKASWVTDPTICKSSCSLQPLRTRDFNLDDERGVTLGSHTRIAGAVLAQACRLLATRRSFLVASTEL